MGMQIGFTPYNPVTPREIRHVALRQAEARTTDIASYLPWSRESEDYIPLDIKAAAQELERISYTFNRRLQFVVDHESNEVLVKVIDTETDKVIKVLPPEELQRLHGRIRETLGFLYDQLV